MSRRADIVRRLAVTPTARRVRIFTRLSASEKQAEQLRPGSVLGRRR